MVVVGIILLVLGGIGFAVLVQSRNKHKSMLGAETLTVAELTALRDAAVEAAGAGSFRYRCELVGAAQPHPSRALTAELSGTACVWHRHVVTHKYWEWDRDRDGRRQRRNRQQTVSQRSSETPFTLRDDTGSVTINLDGTRPDGAEKVLDRFDQDENDQNRTELRIGGVSVSIPRTSDGGTLGYQYEEWALRPDRRLYVLGEATDTGGELVFGKPADGPFIVSTRSEEQLRAAEQSKQRFLTIGAPVAGVAGIVALVIGLLS